VDVGTIRSFYQANLALCGSQPSFNFFERHAPVYTHARFLPASKIFDCAVRNSLLADGCLIHKSLIENTVVGVRSFIHQGCEIRNTIIMGCDFYQSPHQELEQDSMGIPHMSIGANCQITGAIIDKNVHIGENVIITDKTGAADFDGPNYYIRDGIVVIPKNAIMAAGTRI
jgi:glucose-1-phosphate adenylyltransferase